MDFGFLSQPAFSGGGTYLDWVISGIKWTLLVSILAWIIAFTIGSVLGVLRTTRVAWLRAPATAYVELFRNVPLLVQMFIWYFVVPEILPRALGTWMKQGMPMPEFWSAVLALGFYTASRVAEQVRSGIQSIPVGQTQAALATGLTMPQVYRHVLLPMGYRIVIPPLTSEFLTIFKNSSVALTIGVLELTAQARTISEYTFRTFEIFSLATVVYVLITLAVTVLMEFVERQVRVPGYIGTGEIAMFTGFDVDVIQRALPYLWQGMLFSLGLTLLAMVGGIVLGTLLALMRLSSYKVLTLPAGGYVNLLRSTPLILVIFWFYFLVPIAVKQITGNPYAAGIGPFYSALIAFTLFEAAYYCEIIRAGIQSVPAGQVNAAYALGLNYWQATIQVVLPQAFRNMVPILLTQGIILFQDTSLVYVVGLTDFMGAASKVAQRDGRLVEMYLFAALVYFILCFFASYFVKHLQTRITPPR